MNATHARLVFAGELVTLLTCHHENGMVRYPVNRKGSIKDVVEALGVPHTEIHEIRADDQEQDFSLPLSPGLAVTFLPADMAPAYPVDVTRPSRLRPPMDALRFLVDENVAGLLPLLRALGFDTAYHRTWQDDFIARLAAEEKRTVLTRDRALLKRSAIEHGRLIRSQIVDEQLLEVLNHFKLTHPVSAFTRCLRCNDITTPVDKAAILHLLEPKTRLHYHSFRRCPACQRIFWRGTHLEKLMERFVKLGIDMRPFLNNEKA